MIDMAYETTSVDCMKSWGEICKVLYSHGCEATRYTEMPDGFQIEFSMKKVVGGRGGHQAVRMPVMYDFSSCRTEAQKEQEKRTKWRSLYYYIKAVFDAIDKGLVLTEQAFMADTVVFLPDGRDVRVIDALIPQIASGVMNANALFLPERTEVRSEELKRVN